MNAFKERPNLSATDAPQAITDDAAVYQGYSQATGESLYGCVQRQCEVASRWRPRTGALRMLSAARCSPNGASERVRARAPLTPVLDAGQPGGLSPYIT